MNIYMSGSMAHMGGDWTFAGVTQSAIDSLSGSLQQIIPDKVGKLQIDCRNVSAIDINGQQMLNVWIECASLRGVEPELVNPPVKLRQAFQRLGFHFHSTPLNTAGHNQEIINHKKKDIPL